MKPVKFGVEPAASGERTLFFEREGRRHYVYSRRDPGRDGLRFRMEHPFGGSGLLVFIGAGLGHHIRPFLEDGETGEIAVLEPCGELFEAVRGTAEIARLARDPRVSIHTGEAAREYVEGLAGRYDALVRGSVRVLSFPPLCTALPSVYKTLEERARSRVEILAGDALTIGRFARLWLGNFLSNVKTAPNCSPVSSLFGASEGGTAVVTGAGPSLDVMLPRLKEYRGRFFLVATDASVRPLAARDILPDLIVSVDPQPLVRFHLEGIEKGAISGVPAVLSLLSCPDVLERFDRRYLFFTLHPTTGLFDTAHLRGEGAMLNYRSVGSYALKVALEMGFGTILLAGFDFSYPGLRVYAKESFFHRACLARWSRFSPQHTVEAASMAGKASVPAPPFGTAGPAQASTRGPARGPVRGSDLGPAHVPVSTRRILVEYAEEFAGVVGEACARQVRVLRLGTSGIRVEGVATVEDARVAELLRESDPKAARVAPRESRTRALEPDPARWGDIRRDLMLTLALRSRIFQGARSGEEATENAKSFLERLTAGEAGFLKFAPPATDI